METVEFGGWVLEVDRAATEAAYAAVSGASTAECECSDCVRFEATRSDLLHPAALALFNRLGIDIAKEAEVMNFGPDHNGLDIWDWLYHFVGRLIAVPEGTESNGVTAFTPLSDDFSFGFTSQVTLVGEPFRAHGSLVQAECFFYEGNARKPEEDAAT